MFLLGKVEHQLDSKMRIRIPNKFRKLFPEGEILHFVLYTPGCIAVMCDSVLAKRMTFYNVDPSEDFSMRAQRFLSSCTDDVKEDAQGRIMIPKWMRDHAGFNKDTLDVVTVGMGDYIEIWTAENYAANMEGMTIARANEIARAHRAERN